MYIDINFRFKGRMQYLKLVCIVYVFNKSI